MAKKTYRKTEEPGKGTNGELAALKRALAEHEALNLDLKNKYESILQKYEEIRTAEWWMLTAPARKTMDLFKAFRPAGKQPAAKPKQTQKAEKENPSADAERGSHEAALKERIAVLEAAEAEGKRIHLMLYDKPDTSTCRYRCCNLYEWTKKSRKWQCVYFFADEIQELIPLIKKASLLTLARFRWVRTVDRLVSLARSQGIPVLYDVDDLVFDLADLGVLTDSILGGRENEFELDYWASYVARNSICASMADGFTVTNEYLGSMIAKKYSRPFRVIRNSLNPEQLAVSEICRREKQEKKRSGSFILGYFSGSPSHKKDLELIGPELERFLGEHRDAELTIVGYMELPDVLKEAAGRKQIHFEPFADYLTLQKLIAGVDVNLVPLQDNVFTNCKSELKFFEAGIVDTLTAASPAFTYRSCIRSGENGFLCGPGEWYPVLEEIYHHKDAMEPMIRRAREESLEFYSGGSFVSEAERAYDSFVEEPEWK